MMDDFHDALVKAVAGPQLSAEGIDLDEFTVELEEPVAMSMGIATEAFPLMLDMQSKLLINRTGEEFVTSDNPVVSYNQLLSFRKFGSNCGLATKGLQMFFPLDPQKMVLLYDPVAYRVGADSRNVIDVGSLQDVYSLNTLQVCSARANIYFRGASLDAAALHRKALPFLRIRKMSARVFREESSDPTVRRELIAASREDVRTNLSLSFLSLRKSAKRWRDKARASRMHPGAEVRSPEMVAAYDEYRQEVSQGRRSPGEFLHFAAERIAANSERPRGQ
jgi:hypothetical protein